MWKLREDSGLTRPGAFRFFPLMNAEAVMVLVMHGALTRTLDCHDLAKIVEGDETIRKMG